MYPQTKLHRRATVAEQHCINAMLREFEHNPAEFARVVGDPRVRSLMQCYAGRWSAIDAESILLVELDVFVEACA